MNKKFLQSVATGIAALSLIASCSHLGLKKESNTCGAANGCAAATKKDEAHKCSAKKDETKKHSKKHKKAAVKAVKAVKEEAKTEEKKN